MSRGPVAILILSRTSGGLSYRFNYSKQVDATNSTISLAAYRFSDRHFHSYANYLDYKYNDSDAQDQK
ncbi:fimbria/pilus outer membrane usher protein [Escherichia coli]